MTLSVERPTLYSHYIIVPRNKNNEFGKLNELVLERRKLQPTYEMAKMCKIFLAGTQASESMHNILFNESNGTNKGSGFHNWTLMSKNSPIV